MKQDFIKFADGEYAFTDEFGKINMVNCDRSEDFVYILLCKKNELKNLQKENRMLMNEISYVRKKDKERRQWIMNYIILVPFSVFLFLNLTTISLFLGLVSSLGLLWGYKLFVNYICGRKKDNKVKIDYAKKKYNENRDRIPELRDEIERLKKESNYRIINNDKDVNNSKYSFKGYGINRNDDDVKIVHITRILSK